MNRFALLLLGLVALVVTHPLSAQGVVVDQGQFTVSVDGVAVGNEDFVIRRAGLGSGDAVFANATVALVVGGAAQDMRMILRAIPPEGSADSYQVDVTGAGTAEIGLEKAGRRFVATVRSPAGEEDREFPARPDTRVVELDVAHHYYFLRDVLPGREIHVLEPRSRRQITLTASDRTEESITLGRNVVTARRVTFSSDGSDDRTVWFDRQGRVLRVEVPSRAYAAERTDLVG
jgi:hypothetical protein